MKKDIETIKASLVSMDLKSYNTGYWDWGLFTNEFILISKSVYGYYHVVFNGKFRTDLEVLELYNKLNFNSNFLDELDENDRRD